MIRKYKNRTPQIAPDAYVDNSAQIIGDVVIGKKSSVWPNVVIRGDVNYIRIGERTNIQDGTVVHVTKIPPTPTILGNDITVGHNVTLHGCRIDGPALVGMGATIMDNTHLAPNVMIGAGALVPEGTKVEEGWLMLGLPAKPVRKLTDGEISFLKKSADNYVEYRLDYMEHCDEGR